MFHAIQEGIERLGFRYLIDKEVQSGLVAAVRYPDDANWDFSKVHDYCYTRGYTIYPGKISGADSFRLCALGAIDTADIEGFFEVFTEALRVMNIQIPVKYNDRG